MKRFADYDWQETHTFVFVEGDSLLCHVKKILGTLNAETFRGHPPGTVMSDNVMIEGVENSQLKYHFQYRKAGFTFGGSYDPYHRFSFSLLED